MTRFPLTSHSHTRNAHFITLIIFRKILCVVGEVIADNYRTTIMMLWIMCLRLLLQEHCQDNETMRWKIIWILIWGRANSELQAWFQRIISSDSETETGHCLAGTSGMVNERAVWMGVCVYDVAFSGFFFFFFFFSVWTVISHRFTMYKTKITVYALFTDPIALFTY